MEYLDSLHMSEAGALIASAVAVAIAIISIVIARGAHARAKKVEEIANALTSKSALSDLAGGAPIRGPVLHMLKDKDYLDLWTHFQDRADSVKEAMFNSVTWTIGFATAILGFITVTRIDPANLSVTTPKVVIVASAIGLLLCVYSLILVWESKKHIQGNWDRANVCKRGIIGLKAVVGAEEPSKGRFRFLRHVWNQVLGVVLVLGVLFVGLIHWAWSGGSL